MVYRHGVLPDEAVPIVVGEQGQVLAVRQGLVPESGPKSLHRLRFTHGHGRLDALPQDINIIRMGEVVVIQQRISQRILRGQLYVAPALGSQHHGEYAKDVAIVDLAEYLLVELIGQAMGRLHLGAPIRHYRGRGHHEVHVRPVIAGIRILGVDEGHCLQTYAGGQGAILRNGIPQGRVDINHPLHHNRNGIVDEEGYAADCDMILKVLTHAWQMLHQRNPHTSQFLGVSNSRKHHQVWRSYGSRRQDHLPGGVDILQSPIPDELNSCRPFRMGIREHLGHMREQGHMEIGSQTSWSQEGFGRERRMMSGAACCSAVMANIFLRVAGFRQPGQMLKKLS